MLNALCFADTLTHAHVTLLAPLVPFVVWMIWSSQATGPHAIDWRGAGIFLVFYLLLVLAMGWWGRIFSRRIAITNLEQSLRRFNQAMVSSRMLLLLWFSIGLFYLNWGNTVLAILGQEGPIRFETPGAVLSAIPVLLAWAGLFWAQFPADRSFREQSLLLQLESNLPVHMPPDFWSAFFANLRLNILFVVVPVLCVLMMRDGLTLILTRSGRMPTPGSGINELLLFGSSFAVFAVAPEFLRFILHTQSLPKGHLRDRLEHLCRANGVRHRDILLWRTNHTLSNAAVMGVLPMFRYVLLSDLLIATMTDEEIEAVFAHEAGHIKNRHMLWYLLVTITLVISLAGPISWLEEILHAQWPRVFDPQFAAILVEGMMTVLLVMVFGVVSRRFERQADVYAAKWIQKTHVQALAAVPGLAPELAGYSKEDAVGLYGASVFNSALRRAASINHVPLHARNFIHGSIASRMQFLQHLARSPERTYAFETLITLLKLTIFAFLILGCSVAYLMRNRVFAG